MTKDEWGTKNNPVEQPAEKQIKNDSSASPITNQYLPFNFHHKIATNSAPTTPAKNIPVAEKSSLPQSPYGSKIPNTLKPGSDNSPSSTGSSEKQLNSERKIKPMSDPVLTQKPASQRIPPEPNYPNGKSGSGGKKIIILLILIIIILLAAFGFLYWKMNESLNNSASTPATQTSVSASNAAPSTTASTPINAAPSQPTANTQPPVQPLDNIFYQHANVAGANKCAPLLSQLGARMTASNNVQTHAVINPKEQGLSSIQLLSGFMLNISNDQAIPAAGAVYGISGQEGCEGGYISVQNVPQSCSVIRQVAFSQFTETSNLNSVLVLETPNDRGQVMLLPGVNNCTIMIVGQSL